MVIAAELFEYTKKKIIELYTFSGWIVWCENYISIKTFKKLEVE